MAVPWGLVDPAALERIVVVSPHLDDAALGTAHLLARFPGSTVLTLYAGAPPAYPDPPTDWDAAGGFRPGDDILALRREEDRRGLAVLGAEPVWLDLVDYQYLEDEDRTPAAEVAALLVVALEPLSPTAVVLPMGIANPDHDTTHRAGLLARDTLAAVGPGPVWLCYEDAGYVHVPGLLAWRISGLFRRGLWPTPAVVPLDPDPARKRAALDCYASQLPPSVGTTASTSASRPTSPSSTGASTPHPLGGRGSWRSTGRSLEQIDRALEVNLRAPIVLARELAKELTDNQVDKR